MTFSKRGCLGGGVVCAIGSGIVGKPVIGATALALGCAMVSACPVGVLFCTARSLAGAIPIAPAPGPSCKKHDERTGRRHKPIIHFPFTQFGCGRGARPRGRDVLPWALRAALGRRPAPVRRKNSNPLLRKDMTALKGTRASADVNSLRRFSMRMVHEGTVKETNWRRRE